jgi:hypothetical protein
MTICPRCKKRPKQKHWNAKWCVPCASELKRRPVGKLTPDQVRKVRRLAGSMFIRELAREVGTSDSNLDRWAKQNGVNINALKYPDELVREVCEYYAMHGKQKTQAKFPHVRIRSVVERYFARSGHEPRQVRWTPDQLVKLAQMAGLTSYERQAFYFGRPNAHVGSIKSAWMKIFKSAGGSINGLSRWIAREYVTAACPFYETDYWVTERGATAQRRSIALWVDAATHLRDDVPNHLASAIQTMAAFQKWLHGRNYRQSILRILEGKL